MSTALRLTVIGLGVLVIATVAVLLIRKRLRRGDGVDDGFTLADLRAMREKGELSEREFKALRDAAIGRFTAPTGDSAAEAARDDRDAFM